MLAAAREIRVGGKKVASTPMLIPSFSSKGFPEVDSIIRAMSETITDSILISAYDIANGFIKTVPEFPQLLVLDSGGYESSACSELSDPQMNTYRDLPWSREQHCSVLDNWSAPQPTLAVTYDHPTARADIPEQIRRANELFDGRALGREILIKPDRADYHLINVRAVVQNAYRFRDFDVLGFTEDELGCSVFHRMQNIAAIRKALNNVGIYLPIHIFGSLDTVSTPLYFLSGADIFDGLTWLRYSYADDAAVYKRNFAALNYGIRVNDVDVPLRIWFDNYQRLLDLQLSMKRFLREQDFGAFAGRSKFFERSIKELLAEV